MLPKRYSDTSFVLLPRSEIELIQPFITLHLNRDGSSCFSHIESKDLVDFCRDSGKDSMKCWPVLLSSLPESISSRIAEILTSEDKFHLIFLLESKSIGSSCGLSNSQIHYLLLKERLSSTLSSQSNTTSNRFEGLSAWYTRMKSEYGSISLIHAIQSKYLSSQELEGDIAEALEDQNNEENLSVEIQMIGAIGGKKIEFHKVKHNEESSHDLLDSQQQHSACLTPVFENVSVFSSRVSHFSNRIMIDNQGNMVTTDDSSILNNPVFELLSSVRNLDISGNEIEQFEQTLALILRFCPNLNILNVSMNPFKDESDKREDSSISDERESTTNTISKQASTTDSSSTPSTSSTSSDPSTLSTPSTSSDPSAFHSSDSMLASLFSKNAFPLLFKHSIGSNLSTLVLNRTYSSWKRIFCLIFSLPQLNEIHASSNSISSNHLREYLKDMQSHHHHHHHQLVHQQLKLFNLEFNLLDDFVLLLEALKPFKNLKKLILSSNPLKQIPRQDTSNLLELWKQQEASNLNAENQSIFSSLSSISINDTMIESIDNLHVLSDYFPSLTEMRCQRNPFHSRFPSDLIARQHIIASIYQLKSLNGSQISVRERVEAERLYIQNLIAKLIKEKNQQTDSDQTINPTTLESMITSDLNLLCSKDSAFARIVAKDANLFRETYLRILPQSSSSSSSSSSHSAGLNLVTINFYEEHGSFTFTKKLPFSTSTAKLESIVKSELAILTRNKQIKSSIKSFQMKLFDGVKVLGTLDKAPSSSSEFVSPSDFIALHADSSLLSEYTAKPQCTIMLLIK